MNRLLTGAACAAPVIATLGIDSLTADSAFPQVNQCPGDVGYVRPTSFMAHVSLNLQPGSSPFIRRVNGEVKFTFGGTSIFGTVTLVPGATPIALNVMVRSSIAAHAPVTLQSNDFSISQGNLVANVVCDLDELADHIASGDTSITISASFLGTSYTLFGSIIPAQITAAGPNRRSGSPRRHAGGNGLSVDCGGRAAKNTFRRRPSRATRLHRISRFNACVSTSRHFDFSLWGENSSFRVVTKNPLRAGEPLIGIVERGYRLMMVPSEIFYLFPEKRVPSARPSMTGITTGAWERNH